ncbi:MAG TPA: 3-hydroxyacyl-CoA dehydrogenase NAD-binding domain-containing protein [Stellaceae bacterium]|nr:3-hydroxyacyl-CoA dehydrogenase NAD-binding domain-containing protein [Stellaceae bacterium]
MTEIRKAAVLGSGVMGGGIAAHIANAGVPVVLLDIVPKGAKNRNEVAEKAIDRLLKQDPAAFMHPSAAKLVTAGNLEDSLDLLRDCDWIIEAVLEDPAVKHAAYEKVEQHRKDGSIVSSNTSTIPLGDLVQGMPERFQRDFCITHFFNPPRYMRLLEIVKGPKTRADAIAAVEAFCDVRLGKGVVHCKDRPGFIANRIGGMWIQSALGAAMDLGLTVEEADAIMGRPFGIPKTGVFALLDLVGIDLMPHVAASMKRTLPPSDPYVVNLRDPELIRKMIAEGYTGRKGKGGFFRLVKTESGRSKEAIDLKTGQYRPTEEPQLDSIRAGKRDLGALLGSADRGGEFARRVMALTLSYAAALVPEIADDITAVDEGMRLGYAWKWGPFELLDRIGVDAFIAGLEKAKLPVPPLLAKAKGRSFYRVTDGVLEYLGTDGNYKKVERRPGVLLLADIKRKSKPVIRNGSASLWDIGDGVYCLEFHTKMNALDGDIMDLLSKSLDTVKKSGKALVVYNEGSNFSVGANIGLGLFAANLALWPMIEELETKGQTVYKAVKYAPFPVVGAPAGMALGGGCEILLHCAAVQAHAESYLGLVEVGVGLVPGWGGCKEMITRATLNPKRPGGPIPPLSQVFETIGLAKVSRSAALARDMLVLREGDGITMNRDRLLADAKAKALALAKDYQPPKPQPISLAGPTGAAALGLALNDLRLAGKATEYDMVVAGKLARVLSGGDTDITEEITEDRLLKLEREAFLALIREPRTLARIETMLETGKPLRN